MKLGKLQKHALNFATQYPGWHRFAQNSQTKRVITSLAKYNLVEVNQYDQFRLI